MSDALTLPLKSAENVQVLVFDESPRSLIVEQLNRAGFSASQVDRLQRLASLLEKSPPNAMVVLWNGSLASEDRLISELIDLKRRFARALLVAVDRTLTNDLLPRLLSKADDWFFLDQVEHELVLRLNRVLAMRATLEKNHFAAVAPSTDSHFFSLLAHDIRTPLNVIGLSLRMIGMTMSLNSLELEEDLRFIDDNLGAIERILTQLSDYFRLFEATTSISPSSFDPRRAVEELLATRPDRPAMRFGKVELIARESCPSVVELDLNKARLAISYALASARVAAAAGTSPIRLVLSGSSERFIVEAIVESPPPVSVTSTVLSPLDFVRVDGVAAERRGMDLAIVAKISELFGGSARLDVVENLRSTIVIDWPRRIPTSRASLT